MSEKKIKTIIEKEEERLRKLISPTQEEFARRFDIENSEFHKKGGRYGFLSPDDWSGWE